MIAGVWDSLTTKSDFYIKLIFEHLTISLTAIVIAGIIGLIIGIFISEYQKTSGFILTVINIIYTIPSISLLGLLIPLSGIGNKTAIIALTVYALLPMVRNTHTGITNIDPKIIEAARGMGSTNLQVLFKIKLPLAFPVIMSGLRNMVVMTIALTGIASFIGAGGLGVAIYRGITTNNMSMTIAGSLLIALMALLMDFILGFLERMVNRRSTRKKKHLVPILAIVICVIVAMTVSLIKPKQQTIHIATKPMTEQYVMGEMLKYVIEDKTDLKVELTTGIGGGTSNIQPAMEAGEFDLYPEYTGTGWNAVLQEDSIYTEDMFQEMQKKYEENLNMRWLGKYGFNNTYGLAVRKDIADKYNLKTYSDLKEYAPELRFGAEYDFFEREDGYDALREVYGLEFKSTSDLDIGLKYQAIQQNQIDVMNIFTTDGQLSISDVVVLEDDKNFYPSYLCMNVVRIDTLEKYPELEDVLLLLENTIDDAKMAEINYLVEGENKEPKEVARMFLTEIGLLE